MRRPDYDFIRQALRHLDKPEQAFRNPLHKKLILESLHAPVISLWEKPFEQTEPAMFSVGREAYTGQDQYELTTSWLYDDFVFLAQDQWTDAATGETGTSKYWAYFIANRGEHPLQEALAEDAKLSNWLQKVAADVDLPESETYQSKPDHFYYALNACSNFINGKWTTPTVLGIYWFWFPDPDDPMYLTNSRGEPKWIYSVTKSTEDFFHRIGVSQNEGVDLTNAAAKHLTKVVDLHAYLKYGDRHAVEVLPSADKLAKAKRNPANRTRPWNTASGPHVLLLDRMPGTQREGPGTHASPRPHRRRGHWKTLQHPRYRHHPQYQKKIYCKPSFVGPRQVNYEGNIYRLVQPIDELGAVA